MDDIQSHLLVVAALQDTRIVNLILFNVKLTNHLYYRIQMC